MVPPSEVEETRIKLSELNQALIKVEELEKVFRELDPNEQRSQGFVEKVQLAIEPYKILANEKKLTK